MLGLITGLIGRVIEKLPIQGRRERWRNEIVALKKERDALLRGVCDAKKALRLGVINGRLEHLEQLLFNAEKD